jgi:hypothetical protein
MVSVAISVVSMTMLLTSLKVRTVVAPRRRRLTVHNSPASKADTRKTFG